MEEWQKHCQCERLWRRLWSFSYLHLRYDSRQLFSSPLSKFLFSSPPSTMMLIVFFSREMSAIDIIWRREMLFSLSLFPTIVRIIFFLPLSSSHFSPLDSLFIGLCLYFFPPSFTCTNLERNAEIIIMEKCNKKFIILMMIILDIFDCSKAMQYMNNFSIASPFFLLKNQSC